MTDINLKNMVEQPRGFSKEAMNERLRKQAELAKDPNKRREAWMGDAAAEKPKPVEAKSADAEDDKWDDPWAEFDKPADQSGEWPKKKAS